MKCLCRYRHLFSLGGDAGGKDRLDLRVQRFTRQPVARDAVAQHAAELFAFFKHGYAVTHEGKIICRGKAGRAAADDGDSFSGSFGSCRHGYVAGAIHRHALESADVERVVDQTAAAVRFARMLTNERAGGRERVVFANQAHRVGVAAGLHQSDIARDVHMGGTQRHTRHRRVKVRGAVALQMGFIVVAGHAPANCAAGRGRSGRGCICRRNGCGKD